MPEPGIERGYTFSAGARWFGLTWRRRRDELSGRVQVAVIWDAFCPNCAQTTRRSSEGKSSAVNENFRVNVVNVMSPNRMTRTVTLVHPPEGHFSGPVVFENGTVSGVKQFCAMIVRGSFFPTKTSDHSGAAKRGLSSHGSRDPHARTTSYGAMNGTATTTPRRTAIIENPASPVLVLRASLRAARKPTTGAEIAMGLPAQCLDAGVEETVDQVENEHRQHKEVRIDRSQSDDHRCIQRTNRHKEK